MKGILRNNFAQEKTRAGNRCGWPLKASPPTVCASRSNLNVWWPTHFSSGLHGAITRTFFHWWCKVFPRGEIAAWASLHSSASMARNEHGRRIIEVIYQAELIADCRALAEPWGRQRQFCIFLLPPLPPSSSSSSWQHINYDWLGSSGATKLPTIAAKLLWRNASYSRRLELSFIQIMMISCFVTWQHTARFPACHHRLTFSLRNLRSYFYE